MSLFFNPDRKLRAAGRLLIFYAAVAGGMLALMIAATALLMAIGAETDHPHFGSLASTGPWTLAAAGLIVLTPAVGITALARRLLDRRPPLASLGLRPRNAPAGLTCGFLGGVIFLAVTCATLALTGGATFTASRVTGSTVISLGGTLVFFAVFAASEEFLLRGYPIKVLDESWSRIAAILTTSLAFGLLHLFNPGATLLPAVNVTLAGVILALVYLQSGSLWLAIGFHWGWNVAEGSLFGFQVSGFSLGAKLLEATPREPDWLSGGAFGPEGSVVLTATCAILIVLLLARKIPYPPYFYLPSRREV